MTGTERRGMTCDCGGQIHQGLINGRPGAACIACGMDANDGCGSGVFNVSRGGRLPNTQNKAVPLPRPNKYGAVKTACECGRIHDSKKEAARCGVLRAKAHRGEIAGLEHQPRYELIVNGQKIGRYTGDFRYVEDGALVVEDAKSSATRKARDFGLRKKLLKALHGIDLREV